MFWMKSEGKAQALILPKLQKEFERVYMDRLLWKTIKKRFRAQDMETRDTFIHEDELDREKRQKLENTFSENQENTPNYLFSFVELFYYVAKF